MVIVKSKITGKFLRRHSGSYNHFRSKKGYDKTVVKRAREEMGCPRPKGKWDDPAVKAWQEEYNKIVGRLAHEAMFNAEAIEARVYATPGSATASVGVWNKAQWYENRDTGGKARVYRLPEHLEIHEVVAGNLCLVNPDDDEETKRRKEKHCR